MRSPYLDAAIREIGIDAFRAEAKVARRTVFNWMRFGVPPDKVALVSSLTGIPPSQVRPDLASLFQAAEVSA
jgi:hypothetical protein